MKKVSRNKQTVVKRQREWFTSNRQSFETALELSTFEYNSILFGHGVAFLEDLFPEDEEFSVYYTLFSRDENFWKWFRIEYAIWEDGLAVFYQTHGLKPSLKGYLKEFKSAENLARFESSFQHQYLKYFQGNI